MPAAWISAGVGLYGALSGSGGGGGGGSSSMYVPQGLQSTDTGWQQNQATNQGQLNYGGGFSNQVDPNLQQSYQQLQNINYQPYLQASQQAGQQYGQLANQYGAAGNAMMGQAGQSFGQQQALQNAGQQVYNMGMDPQNALYNRTQQQVQDQSAATNSMYGLGTSGVGAGLQNQAMSNFNIDWQNQQLQRASQGASSMNQLDQTAGQYGSLGGAQMQAGMGYYGQQPGATQQSGAVPMQAQQQVYGQGFTNAQNYGSALQSAMSPYQSQQNAATTYMGLGNTAQYQSGQLGLQQQQYQNQQLQQAGNALGNVNWGQLGSAFNSGTNNGNQGYLDPNNPAWSSYTGG